MRSFAALNHFVTREVRAMLVHAQRNSNQHFGAVLAHLDDSLARAADASNTANTADTVETNIAAV
eukprot:CAMPEP_0171125964 /NCGR_PEP_ID=MMETSP0766_2-20121228/112373_1 /TAXON_ID=439317 /ORGANISM="Gambierdiscus australes, Strain CAWD 149" /LENGTH=64 /DNA_ID=CAMNT_0011588965 /DNA_START=15 /DNA_END=209 /DNA_ORIENTATION=-